MHQIQIVAWDIPSTQNKEIYSVLQAVEKALNIDFSRDQISAAHRLVAPKGRRFHPNIVVQFISRTTKATWINAVKQKRKKTMDMAPSLTPGPVYIVDHLKSRNKALLGRAKQVGLEFAWTQIGKILIRKTPVSQALQVALDYTWTRLMVWRG